MENGIIRTLDGSHLASVDQLIIVVVIISLATLGVIQFIKEIPKCKKWSKRLMTVLVIFGVTLLRTHLIPHWVSDFFMVFLLAVSFGKIGYDAFIEGIPNLIRGRLASLGGGSNQSPSPK